MKNILQLCVVFMLLGISCSDESRQSIPESTDLRVPERYLKSNGEAKTPDFLEQNWDSQTRMRWWYTSQGSRILPYKWFLALEQSDSKQLLSANENLESYRFITWPADPRWNPDGLPIGLVADIDSVGVRAVGVTCAACHTSKVAYKGKQVIVEGGPAHHDFDRFITDIAFALQQTVDSPDKLKRFVKRVLGFHPTATAIAELKDQLSKTSIKLGQRVSVNHPQHPNGYGRLDAFGSIFNEMSVFALNEKGNAHLLNAPVSYPMLWDTPQHDVVHWNGSAVNAGIGAYLRNVGEAIGVFGDLRLKAVTVGGQSNIKFAHHININNLNRLEAILRTLWSPLWPEQLLPAINQKQAVLGKQLYIDNCLTCHAQIKRDDPARKIEAKMIPITALGTDPAMAKNSHSLHAKTGLLQGRPELPLDPDSPLFGAESPSVKLLSYGVLGVLGEALSPAEFGEGFALYKAVATEHAIKTNCDPEQKGTSCMRQLSYKARPLNGIWASAPFLHNGAVPNLWELLQKPEKRVTQFNVGSWEMDPVKVGFVTYAESASSLFNTLLPGNTNTGHDYGTALSDADKWALIEYLKTL